MPLLKLHVQAQTNPLQVENSFLTRNVGIQTYPKYADSMVLEIRSDDSNTDSEYDTGSDMSDVDIIMNYLLNKETRI